MYKISLGFALAGALTMGCMANYDYTDIESDRFSRVGQGPDSFSGNLNLVEGELDGEFGAVRLNAVQAQVNGYDDGGFAYIENMGSGDNGVGMHIVEIAGGVDHPDLQDGFAARYTSDAYYNNDGALAVQTIGCSGDSAYDWDYDQPAGVTEIEVIEVDEGVRVEYTSQAEVIDTFTGVGTGEVSTSTGAFVVVR